MAGSPADQPWWLVPLGLAVITLAAFLPTFDNGFVDWDDTSNLVNNLNYRGLGWTHLHWMLTTFHMGHYIPVTWVTFGLDYLVWGMNPVGYHLTNLLLHIGNVIALYLIARRLIMAGIRHPAPVNSAFTLGAAAAATLFAVHPLRVESVAWATERRDVLCGLFYLLAVLAYLRARDLAGGGALFRQPTYWVGVGLFTLALLSKSMAVSLPVVLLALDVYPLRRLGSRPGGWWGQAARRVWLEKAPFALLSLGASVVALVALGRGMTTIAKLGWSERVTISIYSLAFYLWKMLLPFNLLPIYELPERIDPLAWPYAGAAALVAGLSAAAVALRARWPGLLTALACYVAILLPVLGIVQNGPQIAADRYTYLAGLPWAVLVGGLATRWWAANERRLRAPDTLAVAGLAMLVVVGLGTLTWKQVRIWRTTETLWARAADTGFGQYNLGVARIRQGRFAEAERHLRRAAELRPDNADVYVNLGGALFRQGRVEEAIAGFRRALVINPRDAVAHNNLGYALTQEGQLAEAASHFREALRLAPGYAEARGNLQRVMAAGAPPAAAEADALMREGLDLLYAKRDPVAAGTKFREVLEQNPAHYGATYQLATALDRAGRPAEARPLWEKVLAMAEGYKDAATASTARARLARRP